MGYRVGHQLAERYTKDRPRFPDTLEIVKFLCKDLWTAVFRKQMDNLKTNHRGVYVLTDHKFRIFTRMGANEGQAETMRKSAPFLAFPCGLIRGVLFNLGVTCLVSAEVTELPACIFQIKISK
jgi:hypothetical protein